MSIFSSDRKSSLSKRSSSTNKSFRRSVRFQLDFKTILTDIEKGEKEQQRYTDLCRTIREAGPEIKDDELLHYLSQSRNYVNVLGKVHYLFVQVLLTVKWAHRNEDVAEAYQNFVVELCSAHNYFTRFAIEQLVSNFKPVANWEDGLLCEDEEICYERVHSVLKVLLQVVPMSVELLVSCVGDSFPYIRCKQSSLYAVYISNVLRILDYRPELRQRFLTLVIQKLLTLDVYAPRSELDEDEEEMFSLEETEVNKNPIADSLDLALEVMFRFVHSQCHQNNTLSWQRTKALYTDMIGVFDKVILPTHASHHVQFLMFYLLSFKSNLVMMFLQFMWQKMSDPNVFHVIRQAAIGYIASLLSRAKYIPMSALKDMLTQLSSWIHRYISNTCDSQPSNDPRLHSVFYSACQALFYLIAFRHKDIVLNSPKGLVFLQNLNLSKVVTCQLNPLRVCLPAVTQNFASVARHYQLAYCYSVMEHNRRSTIPVVYRDLSGVETSASQVYLDSFFPFDPYKLKRTNKYIIELYREYDSSLPDEAVPGVEIGMKSEHREEEDDFLMDQSPNNSVLFTYGTSPGFLQQS